MRLVPFGQIVVAYEHIQAGTQAPRLQFGKQRILVDDLAARTVDNDGVIRQLGQQLGGNGATCLIGQSRPDNHYFALPEQGLHARHATTGARQFLGIRVIHEQLRLKGGDLLDEALSYHPAAVEPHLRTA